MRGKGFTILELMVTVSIIALLLGGAFVYLGNAQVVGRDARRLSDVSLIGRMIDTATAVNRGTYPLVSATVDVACADELASGINASSLDLSIFHGTGTVPGTIPKDPKPVKAVRPSKGHCTNTSYGYIYATKAPTGQPKTIADTLLRGYVLEVALEQPANNGQSQFMTDPSGAPGTRHAYMLQGPYAP